MQDSPTPISRERLGVFQIFGATFVRIWQNRLAFLIYVAGMALLNWPFFMSGDALTIFGDADPLFFGLVLAINAAVIPIWMTRETTGQPPSAQGILGASLRSLPRSILTYSAVYLISFLLVVLPVLVSSGVALAMVARNASTTWVGGLYILLNLTAWLWGLYCLGVLSISAVVSTLERRWLSALGRAVELTKGYRFPILGLLSLGFLWTILILILAVGVALDFTLGRPENTMVKGLAYALLHSVISASWVVLLTLLFLRLRRLKEGPVQADIRDVFR